MNQIAPYIAPALALFFIFRRGSRTRRVKANSLWRYPIIITLLCVSTFAGRPFPELLSLAIAEKFLKRKLGARIVLALLEDAAEYELERVYTFTLVPDFFRKLNFRMVPHSALPEKVLSECAGCPKRDQCNEIALVYEVREEARQYRTGP